jgi:hypothetical protein
MADSSQRWFLALGGAALMLALSLGGLVVLQKRRAQLLPPAAPLGCGPQRADFHPLPDAESPPVIFWAAGAARLFVDDQPAFSAPDHPRRLAPGEHAVRIEAGGAEPILTRIRVDPFTPVLLHAELDPQVGLSLVRLGAHCLPCQPAPKPVDLSPARNTKSGSTLPASAGHLRHDRWPPAADAIRHASPADRTRPIFFRLAAITAEDGAQHDLARALLDRAETNDLKTLLPAFDRLTAAEAKRRKDVTLARWNKLTEWFASLSSRYQGDASSPVSAATKRFSQLSQVFDTAVREGKLDQQAEVVRGGEQALTELVKELRALKPDDCRFQQDLSAVGAL